MARVALFCTLSQPSETRTCDRQQQHQTSSFYFNHFSEHPLKSQINASMIDRTKSISLPNSYMGGFRQMDHANERPRLPRPRNSFESEESSNEDDSSLDESSRMAPPRPRSSSLPIPCPNNHNATEAMQEEDHLTEIYDQATWQMYLR